MRNTKYILVIFGVFLVNMGAFSAENDKFKQFTNILGSVESDRNPAAFNKKERAIGIYQIRPAYFEDAKEFDVSLGKYKHQDCTNVLVSGKVVYAYMMRYEKEALNNGNFETMARLHNSGPNWKRKKHLTNNYWRRFQSRSK